MRNALQRRTRSEIHVADSYERRMQGMRGNKHKMTDPRRTNPQTLALAYCREKTKSNNKHLAAQSAGAEISCDAGERRWRVTWASSNGRGRSGMYGLSLLRHSGAWRQSGASALVQSRWGVRSRSISDVVVPSSFAMLARKVNLGMDDALRRG